MPRIEADGHGQPPEVITGDQVRDLPAAEPERELVLPELRIGRDGDEVAAVASELVKRRAVRQDVAETVLAELRSRK